MFGRDHNSNLWLIAAILLAAPAARADTPISTEPGKSEQLQALNYADQAGGSGLLSLVWRQSGLGTGDPVTLKWSLFSAGSVDPVNGTTISARPLPPDLLRAARTGSIGCPAGSFCPSAVVAYTERVDATHNNIRVLRFGDAPGWDVAATASPPDAKSDPQIVSDGGAGAIVAWVESSGSTFHGRVQRLDGDGVPQWGPQGVPLGATEIDRMEMAGDGNGGAYFVFEGRCGFPNSGIFAMHIDGTGAPVAGWPANGLLIRCGAGGSGGNQPQNPGIVSDGAGGAYIIWSEYESIAPVGQALQPRVVRINPDGSRFPGWLAEGNRVAPRPDSPVYWWDLEPDGAGGVLLACTTFTPDGISHAMVQRSNGDGSRPAGWPAGGLDGSNAPGDEVQPAVVGQSGGAVVVWIDHRNCNVDQCDGAPVYGARFLSDGSRASGWPAAGVSIGVASAFDQSAVVGTGVDGSTLVAWTVVSSINEWDLAGADVTSDGQVSSIPLSVPARQAGEPAFAITSPIPSRGVVRGEFTLASSGHVLLEVHDVAGRSVARLMDGAANAGRNAFEWDARDASGGAVRAGVYFLSLRSAEGARSRMVVIAR